jgi:hypothetical protein
MTATIGNESFTFPFAVPPLCTLSSNALVGVKPNFDDWSAGRGLSRDARKYGAEGGVGICRTRNGT